MDIWIWSFTNHIFDGEYWNTIYNLVVIMYIHKQLVQQLQQLFGYYAGTKEEIILYHCDLFNLIEIYFQLCTRYKYQYQQSLSYASIANPTQLNESTP